MEDAAKKLKGDAKQRWASCRPQLAKFDDIKPPAMPVAQAMIDNGKDVAQDARAGRRRVRRIQRGSAAGLPLDSRSRPTRKIAPPAGVDFDRPPHGAGQLAGRSRRIR